MITTTLERIQALRPSPGYWRKLLAGLGKAKADAAYRCADAYWCAVAAWHAATAADAIAAWHAADRAARAAAAALRAWRRRALAAAQTEEFLRVVNETESRT
jgi:hypothetical protein